jgi:soluble lytic murein transglycosylase-like protein
MGLMQLMPATAGQFGIENPFDAAANVDTGARFLKQLLNRYSGDIPRALGAYNAGPAKVDAAGGVPAIPETVDYVRQIMSSLPFIEH